MGEKENVTVVVVNMDATKSELYTVITSGEQDLGCMAASFFSLAIAYYNGRCLSKRKYSIY